jgi:hypothetical protein
LLFLICVDWMFSKWDLKESCFIFNISQPNEEEEKFVIDVNSKNKLRPPYFPAPVHGIM